ncbi:MAG: hypothetical protein ACRDX8_00825 [Acidimicrobiales bacterium]
MADLLTDDQDPARRVMGYQQGIVFRAERDANAFEVGRAVDSWRVLEQAHAESDVAPVGAGADHRVARDVAH